MQAAVALRERKPLAALFNSLMHKASQGGNLPKPDARNLKTFRQLVLAVLVKRTTRLLALAQVAAG